MKRVSIAAMTYVLITMAAFSAVTVFAAAEKKASPMAAPELKAKQPDTSVGSSSLSGKVVETMTSNGYTYVLLEKNGKKTWVAVPEMKVTVGQELSLRPGTEMGSFYSKSLNKTFDSIIFSAGPMSPPQPAGGQGNAAKQAAGNTPPAPPAAKDIKVEKATGPNAYTVAEIIAQSATLDKKQVVVRGQVVKVAEGIMGVNFIHLQDGTGDPKKNTHKLVITSESLAAVGDVITVKGTLIKDKDFGSGYKYNVIIEKAAIAK
jgi:hypothetical protein